MNLTKEQKDALVEEAGNDLVGHCAIESVTGYVVRSINEKYHTEFEDTLELVEFIQEAGFEIWECPDCGWYTEYLKSYNSDDEELDEPVCSDCAPSAVIKET